MLKAVGRNLRYVIGTKSLQQLRRACYQWRWLRTTCRVEHPVRMGPVVDRLRGHLKNSGLRAIRVHLLRERFCLLVRECMAQDKHVRHLALGHVEYPERSAVDDIRSGCLQHLGPGFQ